MGHLGWSSTSRCLTSFGTSCWSACPPSPPRGRLRRGRWAGDLGSPLPSLGRNQQQLGFHWPHTPAGKGGLCWRAPPTDTHPLICHLSGDKWTAASGSVLCCSLSHMTLSRYKKLEDLLEKSFSLVKMPSLQPVVMCVMKHLPKVKTRGPMCSGRSPREPSLGDMEHVRCQAGTLALGSPPELPAQTPSSPGACSAHRVSPNKPHRC